MDEPAQDGDTGSPAGLIQRRILTLRVMRETFEADLLEPAQDDAATTAAEGARSHC